MVAISEISRTISMSKIVTRFSDWIDDFVGSFRRGGNNMPSPFIPLYDGNFYICSFDLPSVIIGENQHEFKIIRAITDGAGGNGVLFLAQKWATNYFDRKELAIKVSKRQDGVRIDRFRNEARIMSQLDHENIATYYDNGSIPVENERGEFNIPWIAMELGGCNLRRHVESNGKLPLDLLIKVGVQMCDALSYFHRKDFIHRDIKPENFVWVKNSNEKIKMIDFGIAKKWGEDLSGRLFDNLTKVNEFVGPVFFLSPELIAYSRDDTKKYPVDYRSDIFQLGKVFWYLATTKISSGVPSKKDCPALWELVMNMIPDNPEDRIQSTEEVKKFLLSL